MTVGFFIRTNVARIRGWVKGLAHGWCSGECFAASRMARALAQFNLSNLCTNLSNLCISGGGIFEASVTISEGALGFDAFEHYFVINFHEIRR